MNEGGEEIVLVVLTVITEKDQRSNVPCDMAFLLFHARRRRRRRLKNSARFGPNAHQFRLPGLWFLLVVSFPLDTWLRLG